MITAIEQLNKYSAKIEKILNWHDDHFEDTIGFANHKGFAIARNIVKDLNAKIEAYGERAFPLSQAQDELVSKAIEAEITAIKAWIAKRSAQKALANAEEETKSEAQANDTVSDDFFDDTFFYNLFGVVVSFPEMTDAQKAYAIQKNLRCFDSREDAQNNLTA